INRQTFSAVDTHHRKSATRQIEKELVGFMSLVTHFRISVGLQEQAINTLAHQFGEQLHFIIRPPGNVLQRNLISLLDKCTRRRLSYKTGIRRKTMTGDTDNVAAPGA